MNAHDFLPRLPCLLFLLCAGLAQAAGHRSAPVVGNGSHEQSPPGNTVADARDTAPSGALIAYATAPGSTADDRRDARNGLYTGQPPQALRPPGLRLENVFARVREGVEHDSDKRQHSAELSTRPGKPFYFMSPVASVAQPPVLVAQAAQAVVAPAPRVGDSFRDCAECPEMVVLPSGSFDMGDLHGDGGADEKPVRTVRIEQPFAMGKYEVTVGEFRRFAEASGYRTNAELDTQEKGCLSLDPSGGKWAWREGRNWRSSGFSQEDSHPVVCVSWNDVQAYIKWLSQNSGQRFRLASEAEFEYALRAGGRTKWPWGDDPSGACRHGNVADQTNGPSGQRWGNKHECRDGYFFTSPVGQFQANAFGLYDLSGNVWEWVQDCDEESYNKGQPVDSRAHEPGTNCVHRVIRGGSLVNYPKNSRSAFRFRTFPDKRLGNLGFRLSRTLP